MDKHNDSKNIILNI